MTRALIIGFLFCACAPPTPAPTPRWSVKDSFIRDPEGRAVILRGANVSGRHKEPPYFDFHSTAEFEAMRNDWGMNSVRFLVEWAAIEPERGVYDEVYLDEVAKRVRQASDAGLLVFVDMHQDLYGEGFAGGNGAPKWTCDASHYAAYTPTTPWFLNYVNREIMACVDGFWTSRDLQAHYVESWKRLAQKVAAIPNCIGFDPMNEPFWGNTAYDIFEEKRVAPLYKQIIAVVRETRSDSLAFLEPGSSRNLGLASNLPRFSEPDVVYAPHAYDTQAESGMGFDSSRRAAILQNVALLKEEADKLGAALVLGEYGGMAQHPGIGEYMDAVYAASGTVTAGALYWDYGKNDSYALLAADGSEKPELLAAVVRPFPERVAGRPLEFSFDAASEVFKFRYTPDTKVTAPTLVSLPTKFRDWNATCEGCEVEKEERQLRVTRTFAEEVTVTLQR
jgi:endoglycosylceramidase